MVKHEDDMQYGMKDVRMDFTETHELAIDERRSYSLQTNELSRVVYDRSSGVILLGYST